MVVISGDVLAALVLFLTLRSLVLHVFCRAGAKDVMASTELETELAAVNGEMQGMGLRADK